MAANVTRREALKALAGVPGALADPDAGTGYNVLFLMSDEHSPHAVGCLGNRVVKTPAIDGLAAQGAAFSAAYTQNPVCVPSRASFITGRMPSNVGVFGNNGGLRPEAPTMADAFKKAGYVTGWFGKTHWGGDPRMDSPRLREAAAELKRRRRGEEIERSRLPQDALVAPWPDAAEPDTIAAEHTIGFLKANRGRRFFAGASFIKPHFPFIVQENYYRRYEGMVEAPRVTPKMIEDLPAVSKVERERYGFAGLSEAQIKKARAMYYGMVTYIDDRIAQILRTLDQLGLRENTIILYTSDHGEMGGEHGLWYKNSFYQASVGIPFVWSFPKAIPRGVKVAAPAMNMDIFPTLCDLCGLPKPAGLEGSSLLPLMTGRDNGAGRYALSESFRNNMPSRMIRTARWKYCYYHEDREHLFDLRNDPDEANNLAGRPEHRDLTASLRERALEGWQYKDFLAQKKRARGGEKP